MKKIIAALMLVFVSSFAFAATDNSALITGETEVSQYTKAIPGGLEVTYNGLWKHGNILEANYTVTSSRGGRVSAESENSKLIDANDINVPPIYVTDARIYWVYGENMRLWPSDYQKGKETVGAGTYINGKRQDALEFEADQPYKVTIRYFVPGEYVLTPTYKLVTVIINGLPVEFKDATVMP